MKPVAIAPVFFAFESDFVDSLRCIPMVVRYKLDTCGIKLKLPEWVKERKAYASFLRSFTHSLFRSLY